MLTIRFGHHLPCWEKAIRSGALARRQVAVDHPEGALDPGLVVDGPDPGPCGEELGQLQAELISQDRDRPGRWGRLVPPLFLADR